MEKNTKDWFQTGRGNVSGDLALTNKEVISRESSEDQGGMEAVPGDAGAKPVFATGESPFHSGRGNGRGYSADSK